MDYRTLILPEGYLPSDKEPFMNEKQKAYFYHKLLEWKEDLDMQIQEALDSIRESAEDFKNSSDSADRATEEEEQHLMMRKVDRLRLLIGQIEKAFARLDNGNYGYCMDTGEEISIKRLEARPIATRTADAQANHEDNDEKIGEE
ncbi:MAG: TraR/DksA C4-type zinc finger protein [Alphaproteobacteria bacterium]|nr:TraR/DksA C4-type zinc finger protein [Alphaproteobacteria bacterium]